jgi:hypothetical protein
MAGNMEHKLGIGFIMHRALLGVSSALLICLGCTSSHAATGKWIKPFRLIQACPRIGISPTRCVIIHGGAAGTPLDVTQTIRNATGDQIYIRVSVGDNSGFIAENDNGVTSVDPALEWDEVFGCAIRGQPQIGMDQAKVLSTCWGAAKAVTKLTTRDAVREFHFYDNGNALHLKNGVVDGIIERY